MPVYNERLFERHAVHIPFVHSLSTSTAPVFSLRSRNNHDRLFHYVAGNSQNMLQEADIERAQNLMEVGTKVCKVNEKGRQWDTLHRWIIYNREACQLLLYKIEKNDQSKFGKPICLQEAHTSSHTADAAPIAQNLLTESTIMRRLRACRKFKISSTRILSRLRNAINFLRSFFCFHFYKGRRRKSYQLVPAKNPYNQWRCRYRRRSLAPANVTTPNFIGIDLRMVKEIFTQERREMLSKDMNKASIRDLSIFDPNRLVTILHGDGFILRNWTILYDNPDSAARWINGLQAAIYDQLKSPYPVIVERWLRKQFYSLTDGGGPKQSIQTKHMKLFIQTKLQFKLSSLRSHIIVESDSTSYDCFVNVYRDLIYRQEVLELIDLSKFGYTLQTSPGALAFDESSDVNQNDQIPFEVFFKFMCEIQDDASETDAPKVADYLRNWICGLDKLRNVPSPSLDPKEFLDYLFSRENSLFTPADYAITQNMDLPLTDYFIASSHNTYLTGDQFRSDSSIEAYSRALLLGFRCIELDCWWQNGDVIIFHGRTLTSKIPLRDVLFTIREYAFVTSEYPVILSIEDNCPLEGQKVIAKSLREILTEYLLTDKVSSTETTLPSPNQLKRKILVKHKKLLIGDNDPGNIGATSSSDDTSTVMDGDGCPDEKKRDVLQVLHDKRLVSHIFFLRPNRLSWTLADVDDEDNDEIYYHMDGINKRRQSFHNDEDDVVMHPAVRPEEMHLAEEWYHGNLERAESAERLLRNAQGREDNGEGLFLVRDSATFIGDVTISFINDGQVNHLRVKTAHIDGVRWYYINDCVKRDTIYELIAYHQRNLVKSVVYVDACDVRAASDCTLTAISVNAPFETTQRSSTNSLPIAKGDTNAQFASMSSLLSVLVPHRTHGALSSPPTTSQNTLQITTRSRSDTGPKVKRVRLLTPCPQPQPHLLMPWYNAKATKDDADRMLDLVRDDGAFLIRHSSSDEKVFVISWRVDGRNLHLRLKSEGRIFIINNLVFESLNQFVECYSRQTFFHNMCLRQPVNEEIADEYARRRQLDTNYTSEQYMMASPSEYVDCGTNFNGSEATEELYRAKRRFDGSMTDGSISFNAGQEIIVVDKCNLRRWRGRLADAPESTIGWFPADCVVRVMDRDTDVGKQMETIELTGAQIEFYNRDAISNTDPKLTSSSGTSTPNTTINSLRLSSTDGGFGGKPFGILIRAYKVQTKADKLSSPPIDCSSNQVTLKITGDSLEQTQDWYTTLIEEARLANDRRNLIVKTENKFGISDDLSQLVVYCKSVKEISSDPDHGHFSEMVSFAENKFNAKMKQGLVRYNTRQLSRVYPNFMRVKSDNFNPMPMWNAGCHMVALNCQTPDKGMQLHYGRFMANGRCGYVLKPSYMRAPINKDGLYDLYAGADRAAHIHNAAQRKTIANGIQPQNVEKISSVSSKSFDDSNTEDSTAYSYPVVLKIRLIAARHLRRHDKSSRGIVSPQVEIEILGQPVDNVSYKSSPITCNGLNPVWPDTVFECSVDYPELALVRFYVEDGDFSGSDTFIGQATLPLNSCRTGFRSVQLCNAYSEPLELSSLLIHFERKELTARDHSFIMNANLFNTDVTSDFDTSDFRQRSDSEEQQVCKKMSGLTSLSSTGQIAMTRRQDSSTSSHSTRTGSISKEATNTKKSLLSLKIFKNKKK